MGVSAPSSRPSPRAPRLGRALPALLLALLSGCAGPAAQVAAQAPKGGQPSDIALLRAAAGRAAVVLLLRPSRWAESAEARSALAALLGEPKQDRGPQTLTAMLQAPSPLGALAWLAHRGQPRAEAPATLPGWDPSRPAVLALLEPVSEDVGAASLRIGELLDPPKGPAPFLPKLRHRLLLPASDARALHAALRDLLPRLGLAALAPPAPGVDAYRDGQLLLALRPGADHVRVEVVELGPSNNDPSEEGGPSEAAPALLQAPVPPLQQAPTPALALALSGEHLAAAYLRPRLLSGVSVSTFVGMGRYLIFSSGYKIPETVPWTVLHRWSLMASAYLLTSPDSLEAEDVSYALGPDLRLSSVSSLTPAAAATLGAAARSALPPASPVPPALASLQLGASAPALLPERKPPTALSALAPEEIREMTEACGRNCLLHAVFGAPLGALRLQADSAQGSSLLRGLSQLPLGGVSLVLRSLPADTPVLLGGLALSFPPDFDLRLPSRLLAPLLPRDLSVSALPAGQDSPGQGQLRLWLRGPQGLFGPPAPLPAGVLLQGTLDLGLLRAALGAESRARFTARTASLAALRLRISQAEGALAAELITDRAGVAPAPFRLKAAGAPPPSTESPGQVCLRQIVAAMLVAHRKVSEPFPDGRAAVLGQALTGLDAPLRCAEGDAATRQSARDLRAFWSEAHRRVQEIERRQQEIEQRRGWR